MNKVIEQQEKIQGALGLDLNIDVAHNTAILKLYTKDNEYMGSISAPEELILKALYLKVKEGLIKPNQVRLYDGANRINFLAKVENMINAELAYKLFK